MKKSSNSNKKKYIVGIVIVFVIVLIILLLLLRHEKLEIEFEVDGELYQTQKLNKGDKLVDIKEPKKEGYTFDGWYLNGKEFDFNTKISEGMVLEARFTKNKYKVNIVYGNVKADTILDIEHDSKVEEPKNPIKEDYTFLGWYVGDEKYDFNTKVTSDLTITAKWKKTKTTYTVEHFLMGLDGKYSKKADETEVLKGTKTEC